MQRKVWVTFFIVFILVSIFILSHAFAQDSVNLTLTFSQDSLVFSKIDTFDVVTYKGLIYTTEMGEPQLPQGNIYAAIPESVLTAVVVDSVVIGSVVTDTLDGTYWLWPTQPPDTTSKSVLKRDFIKPNKGVYSSSAPYPDSMLKAAHRGYLAGYPIVGLLVYPVQYIPAEGVLLFNESIEFTIHYSYGGPDPASFIKRAEHVIHWIIEQLKSLVENPEDVVTGAQGLLPADLDYVVITNNELKPGFEPLVRWKTKKGFRAKIKTTEEIYAEYLEGDNQEKIRNYILDEYNLGSVWFLLGGDVNVVPYRGCLYNGIPCDLYFSDLDGDWDANDNQVYGEEEDNVDMVPDVWVGRASVENNNQVNVFVNKVLNYERWPPTADYALEMLLMGFDLDDDTPAEMTKDYIDQFYIPERFKPVTKIYDSDPGNHHDEAIAALNSGKNLVNHLDHGNYDDIGTGWTNHSSSIDISDVDAQTNAEKQFVFFSGGCKTAGFHWTEDDCIAEHMVQNQNGGGVAYIGNSVTSWFGSGQPFTYVFLYDTHFFKSLFEEEIDHVGRTLACMKEHLVTYAQSDNKYRELMYGFNLLGDPAMPIWTDDMTWFVVEQTLQVPVGSPTDFSVTVEDQDNNRIEDAFVSLSGCGVHETGYTNINGQFWKEVIPTQNGYISVTVTKSNYMPYVSYSKACNGKADVFVRDCLGDDGRMPSWDANHNDRSDPSPPDRGYWSSPDILIDRFPYDGVPGQPGEGNPVPGEINHLYAYVKNIGIMTAYSVLVEFYWADYGTGPVWPSGFHFIGSYVIPELNPGETDQAHSFVWQVPDELPVHTCIWALVSCAQDPIIKNNPGWENNIAWKNYSVMTTSRSLEYPFDYQASIDFKTWNTDTLSTQDVNLSIYFENWPYDWTYELISDDTAFHQNDSTTYIYYGMDPLEERTCTLKVTAPSETVNDSGTIHIAGIIDNQPVGGISAQILRNQPGLVFVSNPTYNLSVSSTGNLAHQDPTAGFFMYGDPNLPNFLYDGSPIVGFIRPAPCNDTLVGRDIYDDQRLFPAAEMLVDTCENLKTIVVEKEFWPSSDQWWSCWRIKEKLYIFYSEPPDYHIGNEQYLALEVLTIFHDPPPLWWPDTIPPASIPETYMGMALDIDCPSDSDSWNYPFIDSTRRMAYLRGYGGGGNKNYRMAIAQRDSCYQATPHLDPILCCWPDPMLYLPDLAQPHAMHVLRNDNWVDPGGVGYVDDELYTWMSTTGYSIDEAGGEANYNIVTTGVVIPAHSYPSSGTYSVAYAMVISDEYEIDKMNATVDMIMCGNANRDGAITVADVVYMVSFLFKNGPEPWLYMGDANGSGIMDIADAVYLVNYLFKAGPPPQCSSL